MRTKPEIAPEEAEDEGIEEELEDADVELSEQPAKAEKPRIDAERFSDEDIQKEIEELKTITIWQYPLRKIAKGMHLSVPLNQFLT